MKMIERAQTGGVRVSRCSDRPAGHGDSSLHFDMYDNSASAGADHYPLAEQPTETLAALLAFLNRTDDREMSNG